MKTPNTIFISNITPIHPKKNDPSLIYCNGQMCQVSLLLGKSIIKTWAKARYAVAIKTFYVYH
jgi:hypothetical protein